MGNPRKLTDLKKEIIDNISIITTDGSRIDTQFRLREKNVSAQVRSLILNKYVEYQDGRLIVVSPDKVAPKAVDTTGVVDEMRKLLLGDDAI